MKANKRVLRVAVSSQNRIAFTLLEILVVIGIISVLVGVLLPSLSRSRQAGMKAQCLARIKEIGSATAIYGENNQEYMPPATIDWHPTQEKLMRDRGISLEKLPVMYGWAELLFEEMVPNARVTDAEEFEPEKWSHFPAQRNYNDRYNRLFNCPQASEQVTHGGHLRVYGPGWAHGSLVLGTHGEVASSRSINASPQRISDLRANWVLLGDSNEFSSEGDYQGVPQHPSFPVCECPQPESSTVGLQSEKGTGTLSNAATSCAFQVCGEAKKANCFSDRHNGGTNYLFGDFHAEWSSTLRDDLACDWDLNGVRDGKDAEARQFSGCEK